MSAALRIEAPTDAQLSFIASLCRDQGWEPPGVVDSKAEASEIIGAMKASTYQADDYAAPDAVSFMDDGGWDDSDVPF